MYRAIEQGSIQLHKLDVFHELLSALVLVSFRLVAHVLQRNRSLYQVTVVGSILLGDLVVEVLVMVLLPHFQEYFLKNLVQCLVALLLSLSLAWVLIDRLVVVKVFFAKTERLKSRRCSVSALALIARQLNRLLHFVDF